MIFDSADYYFTEFQTDLPQEAAGTHIGMYAAWLTLRGLGSDSLNDYLDDLQARRISCSEFLFDACDGKFGQHDVNAEGLAFTRHYYAAHFREDYKRVFVVQFSRTDYEPDDFCSIPDTWHHFDRLAIVLNRRWQDWRAERDAAALPAMPPLEAVSKQVLQAMQGFFDSEGFEHDPANEPLMMDGPTPGRMGRLYCKRFSGGRHWLLVVVKLAAQGHYTLSLVVASCLEAVAIRIRDHDLPEYFAVPKPEEPLPYTAVVRLSQWLRTERELIIEADDTGGSMIRFRQPDDLTTVLPVLVHRIDTVLRPLLARLATLKGLDEVRCTRPLSSSILYTDPFNRLVLSTAEIAGNPRLLELCDELEALGRDPHVPGMRMYWPNLLAHVEQVRERELQRSN